MSETSAVCELYGLDASSWTKYQSYKIPLAFYSVKEELEAHLSRITNDLFNIQDNIILFDLTNTYFEGRKEDSVLAQFGRSKEKRGDCKLVVLALVINAEGFIKYSSVLEGNTSEASSLPRMIEQLTLKSGSDKEKTLVVLDAGIATEDNLKLVTAKGYDYLCVSRTKPTDKTTTDKAKL